MKVLLFARFMISCVVQPRSQISVIYSWQAGKKVDKNLARRAVQLGSARNSSQYFLVTTAGLKEIHNKVIRGCSELISRARISLGRLKAVTTEHNI